MDTKVKQTEHFGIDFGTTNIAVSRIILDSDTYKAFLNRYGEDGVPFPSILAVREENGSGKVRFGRKVKTQIATMQDEGYEIIKSIKTALGNEDIVYNVGSLRLTPTRVVGGLMKAIKRYLATVSQKQVEMQTATVAVPVGFSSAQRRELCKAFEKAGIQVKKIISESMAAYIRNRNEVAGLSTVMVFDWGGGTLDISLLNLVPIAKIKKDWLPGIEQKGEGIFIEFNQDILDCWTEKNGTRYKEMKQHLKESFFVNERFSPQYVFLHTFAHLFIRELSNLCGYSTASIKERIYSTYNGSDNRMCGILIYTSTADSDGSLGGLTEQAQTENFSRVLKSMIERGKWCSSDPVCYNSKEQGFMSLNYAACFACTLLPETSCEFRNALLDRCAVCGQPGDEELGLMNWRK